MLYSLETAVDLPVDQWRLTSLPIPVVTGSPLNRRRPPSPPVDEDVDVAQASSLYARIIKHLRIY